MGAYGFYELEYVRTDRNGTKIYHDNNCPHCSGYGSLEKWARTGKTCFECGGSGLRPRPKIVKIYTPEHRAKLDAQRPRETRNALWRIRRRRKKSCWMRPVNPF